MTTELTVLQPSELVRRDSDIAGLCKDIVTQTAQPIQGKKYVRVEGWQAIATAHGCVASARDVEAIEGGVRCIGEIRRMDNGVVLCTAEGFVGDDEPTWAKRPMYARRAMCQTRAISRACRSAFAHVVVLMNAGLETTPAEEVPHGGFDDALPVRESQAPTQAKPATPTSEAQIKRLWAIARSKGVDVTTLPARIAAQCPYVTEGDKVHLTWLTRQDYDEAVAWAENGCPVDKAVDAPADDQIPGLPTPAEPAATAPKITAIWPETEFTDATEIVIAPIVNVKEPVKSAKSGKFGPHKVEVQHGEQVITLDTFDATLAALAQGFGAGGEEHEIAFDTTVNGQFTNRKLVGLR